MFSECIDLDVHDEKPVVELYLNKVGLSNYKVEARLCSDKCRDHVVELDVYVDLPSDKRGVHISRLVDSIKKAFGETYSSLIDYLRSIADYCLLNNQYSNIVEVNGRTRILYNDNEIIIESSVLRNRNGLTKESLSISFKGVLACPCAQRMYSFYEKTILNKTPTHIQRALLKITITSSRIDLNYLDIYNIGLKVFSGRLINYLNRYGEYNLLKEIISKPFFAEDVVRNLAREFYINFKDKLSRDTEVVFEITSEETLHEFNLHALLKTNMEELSKYFRDT